MVEAVMYFALGLLTAGLLALMIAPAVWRRAVRLTRMKIEGSIPLTLAEIQADKDQLRAEFAMSTRRLELSIERLREKAAEQLVEISRKREQIAELSSQHSGKSGSVEELERREAALRAELRSREEELSRASAELHALDERLAERNAALEAIEARLQSATIRAEEQTVELVARGTELENFRDAVAEARAAETALRGEKARLEEQVIAARAAGEVLRARIRTLEAAENDRDAELARRRDQLDALRAELVAVSAGRTEMENRFAAAEAARAEAEAQVSRLTVRLEAEASPGQLAAVSAADDEEREALRARLATLEAEHDRVSGENAELRRLLGADWQQERMENALLRERLNDIATEVVRLTDRIAGPDRGGEAPVSAREQRASLEREAPSVPPPIAADEQPGLSPQARSLADRIRALQRAAQG